MFITDGALLSYSVYDINVIPMYSRIMIAQITYEDYVMVKISLPSLTADRKKHFHELRVSNALLDCLSCV